MRRLFPATFPSGQGSDFGGSGDELGPGVSGFCCRGRSDRVLHATVQPRRVRGCARESIDTAASQGAVGSGRFTVCRGGYGVCRRAGGSSRTGGYGGGRRCGWRCRFDCGSTRPTRRRHGPRHRRAVQRCLAHASWRNAVPVNYSDNLAARLRAAAQSGHIDALLDFFGGGYVAMAVGDLKLSPDKVDTIADFEAVKRFGVQSKGGADAATAAVLAELADLIARGELEVPIAGVFALDDVRDAFRQLELRHTRLSWCCDRERTRASFVAGSAAVA